MIRVNIKPEVMRRMNRGEYYRAHRYARIVAKMVEKHFHENKARYDEHLTNLMVYGTSHPQFY